MIFLSQIVTPVLDMVPMSLGIRLAALAYRKELIDPEKWFSSKYCYAFSDEVI